MTTADTASDATATALDADARSWAKVLRFWHTAFYLLVGLTAAAIVASDDRLASRSVPSLVALGVLVVAYLTFGQRAATRSLHHGPDRAAWAYLVVLMAVTCVVTSLDPLGTMLLFVAYSQVWLFTPTIRVGAWLSTLLATVSTLALLFRLRELGESSWATVFQMALGLAFSMLMGLWLHWILRQGAQRAELLRSLQEAQAELGRTQHAAGVVAERERVAREIHDTLAQGFTSIVMLAQTASVESQRGDPDQVERRLDLIERTARENLAEARALVSAFSPAPLQASTLPEALVRLGERLTDATGVEVSTVSTGSDSLPSDVEVVLLRTVQEALSNVRRHSGASTVQVTLDVDAHDAVVTVTDDGTGRSAGSVEGFGLRGMRERVTASGGSVEVEDAAPRHTSVKAAPGAAPRGASGRGTRVTARVPVGTARHGVVDTPGRDAQPGAARLTGPELPAGPVGPQTPERPAALTSGPEPAGRPRTDDSRSIA